MDDEEYVTGDGADWVDDYLNEIQLLERLSSRPAIPTIDLELIEAAKKNDLLKCIELIDMGANVHARNQFGRNPLMIASRFGYSELVVTLLQKGAFAPYTDIDGVTAIHEALFRGHHDLLSPLLRNAFDYEFCRYGEDNTWVNEIYIAGDVPLSLAIKANDMLLCRILLQCGAYPNGAYVDDPDYGYMSSDNPSDNPLYLAASINRPHIASLLMAHGARPDVLKKISEEAFSWLELIPAA